MKTLRIYAAPPQHDIVDAALLHFTLHQAGGRKGGISGVEDDARRQIDQRLKCA